MRRAAIALTLAIAALALFLNMSKGVGPRVKTPTRDTAPAAPGTPPPMNVILAPDEPSGLHVQADEPHGTLTLRGRVFDGGERPVANAVVTINTSPRRTVTTERDGTFLFNGLLPHAYSITARRGGLASAAREIHLTGAFPPVTLVLQDGPKLDVLVLNKADQHPIVAARVEVETEGVFATTDGGGRATLVGLVPGRYVVSALGEGYAKTHAVALHRGGSGASPIVVLLSAGASVYGRVIDSAGQAVDGATVRALPAGSPDSDETAGAREATTDATGFWMIPALPPGTFRFAAGHPDFAQALSAPAVLDGREPTGPIVIQVEIGARLRGRVITRSGSPVRLAIVEARSSGLGIQVAIHRTVFTDEKGGFTMNGLPRTEIRVEARAEDGAAPAKSIDMRSGSAEVSLVLQADGVIAGNAVSARGAAMGGVQIVAIPEDRALVAGMVESKAGRYASAVTDDRGRFRLRGLSPGSYRVRASAMQSVQSTNFWLQPGVVAQVGDEDVRIAVEESSKLKGNVEWARGGAPDPFTVALTLSAPVSFNGTKGAFVVDDVPPGRHILTVQARGSRPRVLEEVEVRAGEEKDVGRIVLETGVTVRGKVVDGDGAAVSEAIVLAGAHLYGDGRKPGNATLEAKTDRSGQFTLEGGTPGPLTIIAEHPTRGRSAPTQLVVDEEPVPVELRLAPAAALQGYVTIHGRPIDHAVVVAAPNGSTTGRFAVTTQADGFYQFERLSEGDYLVTSVLRPSPTVQILQTVSAKVGEGSGRTDIDVTLGGPTVAFDVRDASNQPLANGQIYLATGNVRALTLSQLESALSSRGAGQTRILLLLHGSAVATTDLAPGSYSACVVAVPGKLDDPVAAQRIREHAGDLGVTCTSVAIEPAPPEQRLLLQMGSAGVR